jgi:hypothetical protein
MLLSSIVRPCRTQYEGEMVDYQPSVIQEHARRLYSRAAAIVLTYAVFGFMVGAGVGFVLINEEMFAFGFALVVCLLGVAVGLTKSFELRLQAQLALCQMHVEQHTRYLASMQSQTQQFTAQQGPRSW